MGFEALEVSLAAARAVGPVAATIARRSAPLADQLRRATESVALNLAEARWRSGRDRLNRYRYAAGSADEARAAMRLAVAFAYANDADVRDASLLLDRVLAMCWRLLHPTKPRR